jgi:polyisoprenoid-binding protein YceI
MRSLYSALVVAMLTAVPAMAATYNIDSAHSSAGFSVRHMMVSNVKGEFSKVAGTIVLDEKDVTKSQIDATIDATTISTHEDKRDAHLKSPDFFDVAKFPTITFKSTKLVKTGAHTLKATGDLTMHGVTKPVTLDVDYTDKDLKDPYGMLRRGASATGKLSRKDFGLTWNKALEAGGVAVSDEVTLSIDVEMTQATPKTVTGSR